MKHWQARGKKRGETDKDDLPMSNSASEREKKLSDQTHMPKYNSCVK